jgi:hypothetical protein
MRDAAALQGQALGTQGCELCCADVHPHGCEEMLQARQPSELVEIARQHGASVHGFTPAWYSLERLASIAAVAARSNG